MKFSEEERMLYDFPIEGTFDLANAALKLKGKNALDIGFGNGGASKLFASNGYDVTAIGLDIDSYCFGEKNFHELGIKFEQILLEDFQPKEEYDLIWASHVLEHTINVGNFLDKCASLLSKDGWLCVMVPPYKSNIVGGHVQTGWNLGQLMYVLLLCGYDIKNGHFIHHGYSICAFVQKSKERLPKLRMDTGDVEATSHLWPMDVKQDFDGMIKQVNWFDDFKTYEINRMQLESLQQQNTDLKSQLKSLQQQNAEILENIKKEISQEREKIKELYGQRKPRKQKTSLYRKYRRSNLPHSLQRVKAIPIIGPVLLFGKRKMLKWND